MYPNTILLTIAVNDAPTAERLLAEQEQTAGSPARKRSPNPIAFWLWRAAEINMQKNQPAVKFSE